MTATNGRRAGVIAALVMLVAATVVVLAQPAGAAVTNPCKVLKKVEIQRAFGGTVASGRKGLSTPGSTQCEYAVSANGERPGGKVVVKVVTTDAKDAFDALEKSSRYAQIDGVSDAIWSAKAHTVQILRGKALVGVQGGFLVTDPLPLQLADDQAQLTGLAQLAADRV
jgi:hypothetical protein